MGKASDHFNKPGVGEGGMTLLAHAVKNGHMDVVKLLLQVPDKSGGAEPEQQSAPSAAQEAIRPAQASEKDVSILKPANIKKRSRVQPANKKMQG